MHIGKVITFRRSAWNTNDLLEMKAIYKMLIIPTIAECFSYTKTRPSKGPKFYTYMISGEKKLHAKKCLNF